MQPLRHGKLPGTQCVQRHAKEHGGQLSAGNAQKPARAAMRKSHSFSLNDRFCGFQIGPACGLGGKSLTAEPAAPFPYWESSLSPAALAALPVTIEIQERGGNCVCAGVIDGVNLVINDRICAGNEKENLPCGGCQKMNGICRGRSLTSSVQIKAE